MPREQLIEDRKLEFDADKSGMIHVRKHPGETQFLKGYGTENFGVSPFEERPLIPVPGIVATLGLSAVGFLLWKYRNEIGTYALLVREERATR